ncbi:hypothetical protein SH661x_003730 [Planctomicrobium sp. SH661]|uniref:hypothetical protein n=1 Tax=Planctomicrobium sp. SH661 TaxID=3448124 RepID=UPI003F5BE1FC
MIDFATAATVRPEIPTTFPKEGDFDHIRVSAPDAFLMFAALPAGRFIRSGYWNELYEEQQQFVRDSLASRGLTLYDRGDGMLVTEAKYVESAAHMHCMCQDRFEFMISDDGRIFGEDHIVLSVINVDSKTEARKILKKFVKFVQEHGLEIY